jgi:hypothetical protein
LPENSVTRTPPMTKSADSIKPFTLQSKKYSLLLYKTV